VWERPAHATAGRRAQATSAHDYPTPASGGLIWAGAADQLLAPIVFTASDDSRRLFVRGRAVWPRGWCAHVAAQA